MAAAAADEPREILRRMNAALRSYGAYEVAYSLDLQGTALQGRYVVSGERFALTLGENGVFCDGRNRYEVNAANREIVIDKVDSAGGDILTNPVHAFDFLDGNYAVSTLPGGKAPHVTLRMTPVKGGGQAIEVVVDTVSALPERLTYEVGDDKIVIKILSVKPVKEVGAGMFELDRSRYDGYEIIDFR